MKECEKKTKQHIFENEISDAYKEKIKVNGIQYKVVPSGIHHINVANKSIHTFKGHFKSVLCGVDYLFSPNLCDRFIPQTDMQVNLLWQENATPKV